MKRFTDTAIWDEAWFRKLTPVEKTAYRFLWDRCDNVGVWQGDTDAAEFYIGDKVNWALFLKHVDGHLKVLTNGRWWLIDFCHFQHPDLHEASRSPAVKSYVSLLHQHGIWELYVNSRATVAQQYNEEYMKGTGTVLGRGRGIGKGTGKGIGTGRGRENSSLTVAETDKVDEEPDPLYTAIFQSFAAVYGKFDNYAKEGAHIKRICAKIRVRSPDDESGFAKGMLETFRRLTEKGDKFWKGQPFLPSALDADGIWPRVLKEMETVGKQMKAEQEALGIGFKFKEVGGV